MPTLLRIQPTNIGRSRTQQHHHSSSQQQLYYVASDNAVNSGGSHVDDWVERHHAPVVTRENILYEDAVDSKDYYPQRTRSLTDAVDPDGLCLRWSPSMKRKLDKKKEQEAVRSGRSPIPKLTVTEADTPDEIAKTIRLHGSVEDGLY